MHISELDTPALLIDLDVMERNLSRMADYTRQHGLRLRPHTKTHKIPALGRRQVELGAAGLTVAKVGEAEVMRKSGTPDLLVAYPVLGEGKLARLKNLSDDIEVTVALDSLEAARQLSEAEVPAGVLLEIDAGLGRVGVAPGPEMVALANEIEKLPNLTFKGITFYPGHIKKLDEPGRVKWEELNRLLDDAVRQLTQAGHKVEIVSGGSTPTMYQSHEIRALNEIRPGTYIFNDRNTVASGACTWDECAASIMATVISTAKHGQMIIDGGSKTFSSDRHAGADEATFGRVLGDDNARFAKMNEEHGFVEIKRSYRIGDRVRIVPNHVCVAMNLHEQVYGIRGENVEEVWKVEGRGKLS